jgi:hypothetical protein
MDVFARYSCEEIEEMPQILVDAFGLTDFAALRALDGYDEEYNYASTAKNRIEYIEGRFRGQADQQALQCLNMLKNLRAESAFKTKKYEVARGLILKTLYLNLTGTDRDIFSARLAILDSWTEFFISYTNRNAQATNEYHKQLISQELGWPSRTDREKFNYVARVLVKYLEQNNIHGFFDFKTLKCGDDIESEVVEHCQKTIAFIQLVEAKSLEEPAPPKVNWCLTEYEAFAKAKLPVKPSSVIGNRLFFVVAGDEALPQPAALGVPYISWRADMARLLGAIVAGYAKPFGGLKSKVREIATQIVAARTLIIESMLASWP